MSSLFPTPCCAGAGLAVGYYNDKMQTDSVFVIHPREKIRMYRTGDIGRYLPDGNIEFLGRKDNQMGKH